MQDWPIFILGTFVTLLVAASIVSIGKHEEQTLDDKFVDPRSRVGQRK
jgi:hypothetical protein